jgi:hypothetical protein
MMVGVGWSWGERRGVCGGGRWEPTLSGSRSLGRGVWSLSLGLGELCRKLWLRLVDRWLPRNMSRALEGRSYRCMRSVLEDRRMGSKGLAVVLLRWLKTTGSILLRLQRRDLCTRLRRRDNSLMSIVLLVHARS